MNQSNIISELNVVNPQKTYPLFSPTYRYFCLNFCSFYCHVILHKCIIFSDFSDFFPLSKTIYSYFLFKILLFITSWKIDLFFRYLTHVSSSHISSKCANIKPFKWEPFEKKPVKEKWVVSHNFESEIGKMLSTWYYM